MPTANPAIAAIDEQVAREFQCDCPQPELRVRVCSNGARQYVYQCSTCGKCTSAVKQSDLTPQQMLLAPPLDESRQEQWHKLRWKRREELVGAETRREFAEKRNRYYEYLQTERWKVKREAVLVRDQHKCQAALPGCSRRALQAHHLTYARIFNEPLFDLVAICLRCHNQLHEDPEDEA